jgi:aspartyl-tRNA(Asn)/glutamyl-tRNA(Gln) amidotransferase subunit A
MDINTKTALELGQMIKNKELSSVELTRAILDNIEKNEKDINAFISVDEEGAIESAKAVQAKLDAGEELSPLAGVPMAIKDNICTKDMLTSCGSQMLYNFKPPYNATVVDRLSSAGAVVLGKLNMDEFAMGGSTETSFFGAAKNPWDIERVPGGSSGGSAASVAAGEAVYTLGSDTGGSIRQPCSFCGVSGIKPTYGAVSRYGLVAFASSLDQIGPVGRDIEDCAAVLSLISGHDSKDSTSIKASALDFTGCFEGDLKGVKIGVPVNYFGEGLDADVKTSVLAAIETLKSLGAEVEEFEMKITDYAIPTYYILACAEASSNLSRYDGIKYGYRRKDCENLLDVYLTSRSDAFGMEVKRRIMLGSFVLSSGYYDAYYNKALKARRLIKDGFDAAFKKYDMIISPVAPTTAYKIGENSSDPLKMYLGDIYTVSVNLAGIPAVSVPCGFGKGNMPVGMQLIGDSFSEPKLVKAASAFQRATDFHKRRNAYSEGGRA